MDVGPFVGARGTVVCGNDCVSFSLGVTDARLPYGIRGWVGME